MQKFTPDSQIEGDMENAARLLSSELRSHEYGLPEWVKNASDAYVREAAPEHQRVIVLIFQQKTGRRAGAIACLDFVGMTSEKIENNFRRWADPDSFRGDLFSDIPDAQGGHGNGGKSYMVQMFEDCSYFVTVRGDKSNRYGFQPDQMIPGYFPDRANGRNFNVADRKRELEGMLDRLSCTADALPPAALQALEERDGFTCVVGFAPRDVRRKIPCKDILDALLGNPQMFQTLHLCEIYAVVDGVLLNDGQPLRLADIEPMIEAPHPKVIPIPETLKDPDLGQDVSTTNDGRDQPGTLTLRTSRVNMRYNLKARHNIVYCAKGKYLGRVPVRDLNSTHYGDKIYGECVLDALAPFETNLRDHPALSQLSRAVEEWIREQVTAYANEFVHLENLRTSQEAKNELQRMNEALDHWKNQFLSEIGIGNKGEPPPPPPPRPSLPRRPPTRVKVRLQHDYAGRHVTFKPRIEFYDQTGASVAAVPYIWHTSDPDVAAVDTDSLTITTRQPGKAELWAETVHTNGRDSSVTSNRVVIDVLDIGQLEVLPTEANITAGGFASLTAIAILRTGQRKSGLFVNWHERDPAVAKVSPAGVVSGLAEGATLVTASDAHCRSGEVPIRVRAPIDGDKGFPKILLSEIDGDPIDEHHQPPRFAAEEGPVCQPDPRYVEANIWWINMASPLARRYVEDARGHGGPKSREWRVYHLERYIEVLVRIKLSHAIMQGEELAYDEIERRWRDEAVKMQERAVVDLEAFLDGGVLPGSETGSADGQ
jgi:hypothetical protein